MEKPIVATTLAGLFIKKEAWDNAHKMWYQKAAEILNDSSVLKWIERPDYFKGVDEIMQRLYPHANDTERTVTARKMFFDSVIKYILQNPAMRNEEIVAYFMSLKGKFRLALITTNTKSALEKILSATNLTNLFDIIETSDESEKDDKAIVFDRFIKKYGKPAIYIGGDRKDSFDYCHKNSVPCTFANLESSKDIEGVKSIHNLQELKQTLENL